MKKKEERADRNRSTSTIARTRPFCYSHAWKPLTPTRRPPWPRPRARPFRRGFMRTSPSAPNLVPLAVIQQALVLVTLSPTVCCGSHIKSTHFRTTAATSPRGHRWDQLANSPLFHPRGSRSHSISLLCVSQLPTHMSFVFRCKDRLTMSALSSTSISFFHKPFVTCISPKCAHTIFVRNVFAPAGPTCAQLRSVL